MEKEKIVYYSDELNDDFANVSRKEKIIGNQYTFINKNPLWNVLAFIVYRIIMTPIAFLYCKLKFHLKIENKKILRKYQKSGYFLYGNHTQIPGDGYIPNLISFPKKTYIIVHPDSVAKFGTEQYMLMIGALPLPSTTQAMRNFLYAIEKRIEEKKCIAIYPEAHIWPYYTDIRPFTSVSFKYPIKYNVPAFCFTTCYKKRKHSKTPKITVYIDGPFFVNNELSPKEQQQGLQKIIYNTMKSRAKENSTYSYIKYIKKDKELHDND